jgi:hypothetical protein
MRSSNLAIALILASFSCVVLADATTLIGTWIANGRAGQAIYNAIEVTGSEISWGGHRPYNPYCKTTYTVVSKDIGTNYPDNVLSSRGKTFTIFKLKLAPTSCTGDHGYFQFALSSEDHAEVVPYDKNNKPRGWHSFSKLLTDQSKPVPDYGKVKDQTRLLFAWLPKTQSKLSSGDAEATKSNSASLPISAFASCAKSSAPSRPVLPRTATR